MEATEQCEKNVEYENNDDVNEKLPLTEDVDGTFEEFNSLPVLYEQKNELSDQIKQSEEEHKHLMQERRAIERQLLNEKQKIEDILEEFRSSKARVLDLTQSYSELGVEMQRMSEDIAVNKELLEEIRNQIVAAEKISVYVYVNGSFDSDKELPDAEVSVEQELFTQLVSFEEAEELTIKAIKALVVMVRKVSKVKQTTDNIEVCYETESLQSFCEKVENLLETH